MERYFKHRVFSTGSRSTCTIIYCYRMEYFSDKTLLIKANISPEMLQVLKPKLVCKFTNVST